MMLATPLFEDMTDHVVITRNAIGIALTWTLVFSL